MFRSLLVIPLVLAHTHWPRPGAAGPSAEGDSEYYSWGLIKLGSYPTRVSNQGANTAQKSGVVREAQIRMLHMVSRQAAHLPLRLGNFDREK